MACAKKDMVFLAKKSALLWALAPALLMSCARPWIQWYCSPYENENSCVSCVYVTQPTLHYIQLKVNDKRETIIYDKIVTLW